MQATSPTDTSADPIAVLEPRQKMSAKVLQGEMTDSITNSSAIVLAMEAAEDIRQAYWQGQTTDGKKHAEVLGVEEEDVSPWEGASDVRVRMAEEICQERTLVQMAAIQRGKLNCIPREVSDAGKAKTMQELVRYITGTTLRAQLRKQLGLGIDWKETYGHSLVRVGWKKEDRLVERTITVDQITEFYTQKKLEEADIAEIDPQDPEAAAKQEDQAIIMDQTEEAVTFTILDPDQEKALIEVMKEIDPEILDAEAVRAAKELRKPGVTSAKYFATKPHKNEPTIKALLFGVDCLYPIETEDLADARWITQAHQLTAAGVLERAAQEDWNPKFTAKVLKTPGKWLNKNSNGTDSTWFMSGAGVKLAISTEASKMFEVLETHYKAVNHLGVPAIYRTIHHGGFNDVVGLHEHCKYADGEYPYVALQRERHFKCLVQNRGIPEMVMTDQQEIKRQRDARADYTSISVVPPLIVPSKESGARITIGPGYQIPERRTGTARWMEPPKSDVQASIEMEKSCIAMLHRRYGLLSDSVPAALQQLHQQHLVDDMFIDLTEIYRKMVHLCQQYMTPEQISRIVGKPVEQVSLEDIAGDYDIEMVFDVRDLDTEWLKSKLSLISELALPFDSEAVVDRGVLMQFVFAAIDPVLAAAVVRDGQSVAVGEEDDELKKIAVIMAGEEPVMREGGENHKLRGDIMRRAYDRSPVIRAGVDTNPLVNQLWNNRMKQHDFQVEQEKNKVIGRIGAKPVLQG